MTDSPHHDLSSPSRSVVMRARLLLIAASILWSLSGVFVKSPLIASIPLEARGPLLACYRALFAGLFLVPFIHFKSIRWRWELIPAVATFALMNVTYVSAMTRTSAAAAIFLQYTGTVWAAVMSVVLLKERFDRTTLIPLVGALIGIVWIVTANQAPGQFLGNSLAFVSGIFYAGVVVSLRAMRSEDSAWLTALNHLAAAILIAPWVLTIPHSLSAPQWGLIAAMGIVQMGSPYALFARGIRNVRTTEAALIPVLEPILNPVWVWIAWGEDVDANIWIGGAFILGSLLAKYAISAWLRRREPAFSK